MKNQIKYTYKQRTIW